MIMHMHRIGAAALLGIAFAAAGIASAGAQSRYPDKPIKIIVGFGAGGGTDVAARIVALKLTEALGQSVVVENKPGASGMIATDLVAKSPADGYTLMVGSQTTMAVAPALYRKFGIDAARDFSSIAMVGISPLVAVVHPSVPAQSLKDFIALAKAKPGTLHFGSGGVGTTPHMAGELLALNAGIKITHVAYRGEAPAINDLLGGQIPFMFSNMSAIVGNVKAGTVRPLAVTSAQRAPTTPEIPTVAEAALPGFEAATWFALMTPAGTPREIVQRLNTEMKRIIAQPDVKQRFAELGMTSEDSTPEALDRYIKAEIAKWAKVIQDAGIKPAD